MRVHQRRDRDFLSSVSLLIPISICFLLIGYGLLNLPCVKGFSCSPAGFQLLANLSNIDQGLKISSALSLLLVATPLAGMAGGFYGKVRTWRGSISTRGRHPLEALVGGPFPPVVSAAVLTTTKIGDNPLVYSGILEAIQIGPEGKIDYVVLGGEIWKSLLMNDPMPEDEKRGGGFPATRKPFKRLAQPGIRADGQIIKTDRLFIESADIANLHIEVYLQTVDGDWLDRTAYGIGRQFGLIKAAEPVVPPR